MGSESYSFGPATHRRRTRYTTLSYEHPIKTERERIEQENSSWGWGVGSSGCLNRPKVGRVTYQKGREEKDGADSSSCQSPNTAQATRATVQGRGRQMDGRTTNESRENKKRDERKRQKGEANKG